MKEVWIEKLGDNERRHYNLAFQLNLRALLSTRNAEETAQCESLNKFLDFLKYIRMKENDTLLDEKYATDTLHFKINEYTRMVNVLKNQSANKDLTRG